MPAHISQNNDGKETYCHIYNKGSEGRKLFKDSSDYQTFLNFLKEYLSPRANPEVLKETFSVKGRMFKGIPHQPKNYFKKVELAAYSLLPNHFHLLVREIKKGSLEKLIRSISTRYAIYYNKKYNHSGSIFSGPYKSTETYDLSQALYLSQYLHREPLTNETVDSGTSLSTFSSYDEYLELKITPWIIQLPLLSYFKNPDNENFKQFKNYKDFVEKYTLNENEERILDEVRIEKREKTKEEASTLPRGIKSHEVTAQTIPQPRAKTPEFIAMTSIIFVILTGLGIKNIQSTSAGNESLTASLPSPTPQVAGIETHEPSVFPETSDVNITETPTPTPALSEPTSQVSNIDEIIEEDTSPITNSENRPITKIIVSTSETDYVNLRLQPTTDSEVVGTAKVGDIFELISETSGWYEIKLTDGRAYIHTNYAEILEGGSE